MRGFGGSHLGKVARPREIKEVEKRLSLTTSPSCPIQISPTREGEAILMSPGWGTWKERKRGNQGSTFRNEGQALFPHITQVGWQHLELDEEGAEFKGLVGYKSSSGLPRVVRAPGAGPLPPSGGRTPSRTNRVDPRPWIGGNYPEVQKAGVG